VKGSVGMGPAFPACVIPTTVGRGAKQAQMGSATASGVTNDVEFGHILCSFSSSSTLASAARLFQLYVPNSRLNKQRTQTHQVRNMGTDHPDADLHPEATGVAAVTVKVL
jgi:hypothetical protein